VAMPEFAAPQQPTHQPHSRRIVPRIQRPAVPLGPGRPLDADVRSGMEARFGHDFSRVRVRHGAVAAPSRAGISSTGSQ